MRPGELRDNVLEVCHAGDIDPAVRHGHDHVGAAEAEGCQELHACLDIGKRLVEQILAGHAHMPAARLDLMHDLWRGEEGNCVPVEVLHHAAIAALMPGLAQGEAGPLEQSIGVVLKTPLGRDGDCEVRCHHESPSIAASSRSVWMAEPTAVTSPG